MTDYAREILPEEEKETEPLPRQKPAVVPVPVAANPVALAETVVAAPVEEPVVAAPVENPVVLAPLRTPQPVAPEERRAALLVAAVSALSRHPEEGPVGALLAGYVDAPASELERATRAVVAVVLRAPAKARRPIRDVLVAALKRNRETALAARLAPRLGGVANARSTPAPPVEDDG